MSEEELEKEKAKGMGKSYVSAFIGVLLMSYVLANIIAYTHATSSLQGVEAGVLVWIGFICPVLLASVLWEDKPVRPYFINTLHFSSTYYFRLFQAEYWQSGLR